MTAVTTRRAAPADAEAVAAVHVRSWQAAYAGLMAPAFLAALSVERRAASWRASIDAGETTVRVAERDGQVLAFVSHGRFRPPGPTGTPAGADAAPTAPGAARGATATPGEVWALYAQPDAWGTGAGTALLRAALVDLAAAGHDACALWVLADNARAVAFYRRAGFTEVPGSRQAFEIGGRMLDEVQMRLVGAAFAAAAGLAGVAASGAADAAGGAGR